MIFSNLGPDTPYDVDTKLLEIEMNHLKDESISNSVIGIIPVDPL